MMKAVLCLFLIGIAAVLAENHLCPTKVGDLFECFEYNPEYRSCMTTGRRDHTYVVCSKCREKWEFCTTKGKYKESTRPEHDCGADYASTPCTPDNTEWSSHFKFSTK